MDDILRPLYQERTSQQNTMGVIVIEKKENEASFTESFDVILLIIVKEAESPVFIKHYIYGDKKAALYTVTEAQLEEWLLLGNNRKFIEWLYHGKVLFDRNEYVFHMKQEMREFSFFGRKIKMAIEFSKLIRRWTYGRDFFKNGHYLDAYNHVMHSLHHLARLAVIENGFYPEVTVWLQVKQMEPEIYKLYEELLTSDEELEKRLELLFIAIDFLIHSRTENGAAHLLSILKEKEAWSFQELLNHPEINYYAVDLSVLLEYLVGKSFVEEQQVQTKGQGIYHRYYRVTNE
ncbi:nucleotidyltransferase-like protein [Pseudobacillus sp. 179-B 2D1 NHS]|uniref:nucleotidyltransferase-like protein n=1 Tax=Pseudobacillus sp. 179-B 2D1 NHS TaxID=3374292 RepID=UPI0038799B99